ncbi:MAG: peptide transporter, partial [Methanobacterium sp.]|nr:peptide transporter [Methanobacterium sp.]
GIINVNQLQTENKTTSELINQLLTGLQSNSSSLVVKPHRLIVMQDSNITQDEIISNESVYSVIIVITNGTYQTYLLNKELEDSMFTRLYLLKGQNITKFSLDYEESGVLVWKVIY